ncbi:MAG: TonB-dependent receptor [Holophagales bacterium]|nr:MAG: TonB-dependent receptor [Holophagales bacterium]
MFRPSHHPSFWSKGVFLIALLTSLGGLQVAWAQEAGKEGAPPQKEEKPKPAEAAESTAEQPVEGQVISETIEVVGYRAAIEESVELKRDAVNTIESIVSEDIGKMPDLNVAEAIQRVPGVTIVREGGEGRQLSLRGLGAEFTQVTLNGMEVPASTGGLDSSGAINRGRAFDFNVFPAELFSRIDVNKSLMASIEEGGVGGAIQLYTAGALDVDGPQASILFQSGYNDLSEESDPRVTATYATANKSKTLGFLVSAARTQRNSWQDGFGTVRFAQPDTPASTPGSGFASNPTAYSDQQLRTAWYPRLPRQDSFRHEQDRTGVATTIQFRPTERLHFDLNYVYSKFDNTTTSYNSFAQFRFLGNAGFRFITPVSLVLEQQGNGNVAVAGTFRNVELRTESREAEDQTEFNQLTGNFKFDINDDLILSGMVGRATSEYQDLVFRLNIDSNVPNAVFSYDFGQNPDVAVIHYNFDVTNPANFDLQTDGLLQKNLVDRTNDTAKLDLDWFIGTGHSLRFGAIYNEREVSSEIFQQTATTLPGVPLSSISRVFQFQDTGGFGSATDLRFLVLDFPRAKEAFAFGSNFQPFRGPGRATWVVTEETAGAYGEYNLATMLKDRAFRLNLGVRYVTTETTGLGWLSASISTTEKNEYDNLLPALNIAWDLTPEVVLRAGASRTMTRPSLTNLAPVKAYGNTNLTVTGGNSQLEPMVADNLDLGVEWYFTKKAVLAASYFRKDIDSFISFPTTQEPLRPEDRLAVAAVYPTQPQLLDPSLIWTYSTAANSDGTKLDGFEVAYQQSFTGLPGFWANFGFNGNYSYVDAETTVVRSGRTVKVPLQGLSKHSWNATLFYETPRWGARVSVNDRDDYITNNLGTNGNVSEGTTGPIRWDMSAFWHITEHFSLTLEGINLTDEKERLYTTGDGTMNLIREINYSGRQAFAGIRWSL